MPQRVDLYVESLAELASVHTPPLQEGTSAWVIATNDYWVLQKDSGAPVGPNVLAPPPEPTAGGYNVRWIRYSSISKPTIELTGDVIAGPGTSPLATTVVGIEGIPIDPAPPANGDALLYDSALNEWVHAPIVFGGGPPVGPAGGDLGGVYPNPSVVGFYTRPLSAAAPAVGDAYIWDGANWTPTTPTDFTLPAKAIFGAFTNSTTQPIAVSPAVSPTLVKLNTVEDANGVSITNDGSGNPTQITVSEDGAYELTYSLQFKKFGGNKCIIYIWAILNGNPVTSSASSVEMGNNNETTLPACPYIFTLNAGDKVQFAVWSDNDAPLIYAQAAVAGPPAIPAIPSAIVTVKRLGAKP